MTQDQLWQLLKEFVVFHPANSDRPCLQLQTWGLLRNFESDLNEDGLGMTVMDKGQPTFFSRRWAESGYNPNSLRCDTPMLVANVISYSFEQQNSRKRVGTLSFDIGVLDVLEKPKARPSLCARRSENDLFRDAWAILNDLFAYLQTAAEALVTPLAGDPYTQITSEAHLAHLLSAGKITAYEIQQKPTIALRRSLSKLSQERRTRLEGLPWRGGVRNLHGVYIPMVTIENLDCPEIIDLEFPDYDYVVNETEPCC